MHNMTVSHLPFARALQPLLNIGMAGCPSLDAKTLGVSWLLLLVCVLRVATANVTLFYEKPGVAQHGKVVTTKSVGRPLYYALR